jgi:hypothetical protein
MRALTVRFPGMRPTVLRIAQQKGITERQAWAEREQDAFDLLAAACHERLVQSAHDLAAYQAEVAAGHLPAMTTRSQP